MNSCRLPRRFALALAIAAGGALGPPLAQAQSAAAAANGDTVEPVRTALLDLIRALVDQGVLTAAKAQEMLRAAGMDPALLAAPRVTPAAPPPDAEVPKNVLRVPFVPAIVQDQIHDQVKQEVLAQARAERWGDPGALPAWLDRLTFSGDIKVRFQSDRYSDSNNPSVAQLNAAFGFGSQNGPLLDSTEARDRLRTRARLGLDAKVADTVQAGARIVTNGSSEDQYNPTSEYFDAGQSNQRYGASFDLAYIRWTPLTSLAISGGRVANPYYGSDLVWAADTTFDSAIAQWHPHLTPKLSLFGTAGAHWLLSSSSAPGTASRNIWLYALQGGAQGERMGHSSFTASGSIYDFRNIEGELNPALPAGNATYANSAVPFRKVGNTLFDINFLSNPTSPVYALASKFRLADLAAQYEWDGFSPLNLRASAEFVRNIGFDAKEITQRIGQAALALPTDRTGATGLQRPRLNGYQLLLQAGASKIVQRGDWNVFTGYRVLQRDAVVAEFTSADYRLGGTDQTAEFLGFAYALANNTSLTLRYISAKSLDLAPQYNVDTWLFDVQANF